tara:strand:+ start:266 stop:589 length:324 start_codon:yes stop_codon:yes gene_type:complete
MSEKKDKKIIFDDSSARHARLKIRLGYDGLTQAEFFRSFMTGYLDKDDRIISYLESYKLKKKSQSKRNMKIAKKDKDKGEDLLAQFGIKDKELDNIFDLIAKEHPDL